MWGWVAAVSAPLLLLGAVVLLDDEGVPTSCLPDSPLAPSGGVVAPSDAPVTSGFGPRWGTEHQGIDYGAALGAPIRAATSGLVVAAEPASGFGNWIIVDTVLDNQKVSTVYGHMFTDGLLVHVGDRVTAGQEIGRVGNAGDTTGAHLHFEVWPGGRLSGGSPVDPAPWLAQHTDVAPQAQLVSVSVDLPVLPAAKGSEEHWQVDTVRVARSVAARFPTIETIGGWRPVDAFPDHPSGRAADIMIPGWDTPAGKALGDQVADYIMANADAFQVQYIIWRQEYRPVGGTPNTMEDRGSPTQNHFDHVHVTTVGHGLPVPGQRYGGAPTSPRSPGCGGPVPGGSLKPGSVPPAFEPWIIKASQMCAHVPAPLLAAQVENESNFSDATSGQKARGYTQFIDPTWAAEGIDGDGDGTISRSSIPDAVMSQASYNCKNYAFMERAQRAGQLPAGADLTVAMLSAYNCGPERTVAAGGVCGNAETQNYVRNIPERARTVFSSDAAVAA